MSEQNRAYQLQITFGSAMLDKGFTAVPNLFLLNYRNLGLSDGQAMWVVHILRFKWSEKDPYPSQKKLPMKSNPDTRRKFARALRNKGLLFTRRLYYMPEDVGKLGISPDQVGKLRSLEYDLASLFHNIVRMQSWKAGRRPVKQFEVEIPQAAEANVGNDVDGAGDWTARLRAVIADKAADKHRQWTGILVQMCADAFGSQPDVSPRRLGRLLKQSGGDLDGALAVAQAIRQASGQNGPPLDDVERLVGQASQDRR